MLHHSSWAQSALVGASHYTSRGDFRVRDSGRIADMTSDYRQIIQ
jgi:hypothetical protein